MKNADPTADEQLCFPTDPEILQARDGQLSHREGRASRILAIQEGSRTKIIQTTLFIQLGCPTYKIIFFISYDSFHYIE